MQQRVAMAAHHTKIVLFGGKSGRLSRMTIYDAFLSIDGLNYFCLECTHDRMILDISYQTGQYLDDD